MSKWKLDADGHVVLKDGNPVLQDDNGNEIVVAENTVIEVRAEAKGHRVKVQELEAKLKAFEGIEPELARKAIETVGKIDAKQLIDAGKVDEVKKQISEQFAAQLTEKDNTLKAVQSKLDNMLIDSVFSNSKFVRESVAIPADIFKDSFGKRFKVENGEVIAVNPDGSRMYSKSTAGEYASPEEALQLLVESHPQKDVLLRANTGAGSGSTGGGAGSGAAKSMKRADFAQLQPAKQAEIAGKIRAGEMGQLVE